MDNEGEKKEKKGSGKLVGIGISLIMAAIFVGPRIVHEYGLSSAAATSEMEAIQEKIGHKRFELFMKSIVPMGYVALCIKDQGENPELILAANAFNARNGEKQVALIQSLEASGGLTADEKEALDKYAYSRVSDNVRNGRVSCGQLADRLESGEWDL